MIRPTAEVAVYLCLEPVDMRKQAASLALLIEQSLGRAVFDGGVYAFANKKRDRVKLVTWERNGLVLWTKRLEGADRYVWPRVESSAREVYLSGRELNALLDGFDVFTRAHRELALRRVG
jgi:transposase